MGLLKDDVAGLILGVALDRAAAGGHRLKLELVKVNSDYFALFLGLAEKEEFALLDRRKSLV